MTRPFDDELCLGLGAADSEETCDAQARGERCEACRAYAASLGASDHGERRLPTGLGDRLRALHDDFDEADPLYVSALAGEPLAARPAGERVPAGEEENPGRRAAHDALAATFAEARRRRAASPDLLARLRATPRRHAAAHLPAWLTDSRWAAAACLLLTATLGLVAGDASARFEPAAAALERPAWLDGETARFDLDLEGLRLRATQLVESAGGEARRFAARAEGWAEGEIEQFRAYARRTLDRAAERYGEAAETWSNSEPGRLWSDFAREGERNE